MNNDSSGHGAESDSSLLEGLFQFAINGNTQGQEFAQLNDTVYERLQGLRHRVRQRQPDRPRAQRGLRPLR